MKISYTLFLTAMVAITMERCKAEYLLVAVDDDDFRKPKNDDDFRKDDDDDFRKPKNDDDFRKQEIEELTRQGVCDEKPCCCGSCYPCPYERIAELRKIVEASKV